MATTTNYGWTTPNDTDLVKNGASAIRTLGSSIDSTLYDKTCRNAVINSNFSVWQRGTSFSLAASTSNTYTADRWTTSTGTNQACTVSRQATGDTTNLPNIQYALRFQRNSGQTGTSNINFLQAFETVNTIPFAGKTVTLSFYARAGANYSAASSILQAQLVTGTGTDQNPFTSYTGGANAVSGNATLTTTWQRFTFTGTLASTATEMYLTFLYIPVGTAGANDYFEITGVQLELGSVANTYMPNQPTYQGELAACQRYYVRFDASTSNYSNFPGAGNAYATTGFAFQTVLPVTMRAMPSAVEFSNLRATDGVADYALSSITLSTTSSSKNVGAWYCSATGLTQYRSYAAAINNSSSGYLGFTAEL